MIEKTKIPFVKGDLPALLSYPETRNAKMPAMLVMHGFVGCKEGDNDMHSRISRALNEQGIVTMQFDFCSCGENESSKSEYNISRLLEEALCAYNFLSKLSIVDNNHIGLVGHSLGGRLAAMMVDKVKVSTLITLNGAHGNKYKAPWWLKEDLYRMEEECKFNGKTNFIDSTGKELELYQEFFTALEQSDPITPMSKFKGKLLVLYGNEDPTVDPRVSMEFYSNAGTKNKTIKCIEGSNHTFNIKTNDFTKITECINTIIDWVKSNS